MRTIFALALAAATSLTAFASAQAQAPGAATGSSIQIPGVPADRYRMDIDTFNDYKGVYQLSDGKYMRVSNENHRFFAKVDGERKVELIPVARNAFVAREKDMLVTFDDASNGSTNDVVLRPRRSEIAGTTAAALRKGPTLALGE